MGYRSYLIFKYDGNEYCIYYHWGHPNDLGFKLVRQIIQLIQRLNGPVSAQAFLSELMDKQTFVEQDKCRITKHPLSDTSNNNNTKDDIFGVLQFSSEYPIQYTPVCELAKQSFIEYFCKIIEYYWKIDIDDMTFGMATDNRWITCMATDNGWITWSWQFLQLIGVDVWLRCATKFDDENEANRAVVKQENIILRVTQLQAYVRRFLAIRRALQPPDGLLYLLAKKDFEKKAATRRPTGDNASGFQSAENNEPVAKMLAAEAEPPKKRSRSVRV